MPLGLAALGSLCWANRSQNLTIQDQSFTDKVLIEGGKIQSD